MPPATWSLLYALAVPIPMFVPSSVMLLVPRSASVVHRARVFAVPAPVRFALLIVLGQFLTPCWMICPVTLRPVVVPGQPMYTHPPVTALFRMSSPVLLSSRCVLVPMI